MRVIDVRTNCKKCGCDDIEFIYKPKDYQFSQWQLPDEYNKDILDSYLSLRKEQLLKICQRCKFSWLEDTLDTAN